MIPFLVEKTQDVEIIVTETEKEALILEYNLIKELKPRYNIEFRDDKAYFHLRLDPAIPFPRFQLVHRPRKDRAYYFGPYPSGRAARETLRFLQTLFPLRTCRDAEMHNRSRPCLEYEVKRCTAPCMAYITERDYQELVEEGINFMEGKADRALRQLKEKMARYAAEERFEDAAIIRDRISAIEETVAKQAVFTLDTISRDVIGMYREGTLTVISVVFIRGGRVVGQRAFPFTHIASTNEEIVSQFISYYYAQGHEIPGEIVVSHFTPDQAMLAEWLTEQRGKKVRILRPYRGEKRMLLDLALTNARQCYREQEHHMTVHESLAQLAEVVGLSRPPERIECYDISHFGGTFAGGSQVTFLSGQPLKSAYRRYRIRVNAGADDYAMMYEVLMRRLTRGPDPVPDLIIVDGGKGQLSVAMSALKDAGKVEIAVLAIAKGERDTGDHIFLPKRKDALSLKKHPAVHLFLQKIRDEAHRFAITYARKVKERGDVASALDALVGKDRKRALLNYFQGVEEIKRASEGELMRVRGIGEKTAEKIRRHFTEEKR